MFTSNQYKTLALLSLLCLWLPASAWAQTSVGCNDAYVTLAANDLIVDVQPTGTDDTVNIQCALEHATDVGVPIVRLKAGDFFISNIMIENFKGTLQGTTRTSTTLSILDNSIDCSAMSSEEGMTPAAIKFVRGEPRLRYMKILVDSPCISEEALTTLIHFTGRSADDASCSNDVIFGAVDRVDIFGSGRGTDADTISAIMVAAEAEILGGCKTNLLGTFKLNQSSIYGIALGIYTAMRSGAQVDINFTEFEQNTYAVAIMNSNQSTTITSNEFSIDGEAPGYSYAAAIYLAVTQVSAPTTTRLVVNNNLFVLSGTSTDVIDALNVADFGVTSTQAVSLAVTNNDFYIYGENIIGVLGVDIDNGAVSANTFNGYAWTGITISSFRRGVSDWVITANDGFADFTAGSNDIVILNSAVLRTIIGSGQNAGVTDWGTGSTILSKNTGDNGLEYNLAGSQSAVLPSVDKSMHNRLELSKNRAPRLIALLKRK